MKNKKNPLAELSKRVHHIKFTDNLNPKSKPFNVKEFRKSAKAAAKTFSDEDLIRLGYYPKAE